MPSKCHHLTKRECLLSGNKIKSNPKSNKTWLFYNNQDKKMRRYENENKLRLYSEALLSDMPRVAPTYSSYLKCSLVSVTAIYIMFLYNK